MKKTHGAHCLVAWQAICLPKGRGGLGIKDFNLKNQCLLLKLLHKLYHPDDSARAG